MLKYLKLNSRLQKLPFSHSDNSLIRIFSIRIYLIFRSRCYFFTKYKNIKQALKIIAEYTKLFLSYRLSTRARVLRVDVRLVHTERDKIWHVIQRCLMILCLLHDTMLSMSARVRTIWWPQYPFHFLAFPLFTVFCLLYLCKSIVLFQRFVSLVLFGYQIIILYHVLETGLYCHLLCPNWKNNAYESA